MSGRAVDATPAVYYTRKMVLTGNVYSYKELFDMFVEKKVPLKKIAKKYRKAYLFVEKKSVKDVSSFSRKLYSNSQYEVRKVHM